MPEEPTSQPQPQPQPQLDETLDAKPYEPPKPQPCVQANTALWSGLLGIINFVLGFALADISEGFLLLVLLGLVCGVLAVVMGIVGMAKVGRSEGRLTGLSQASVGLTAGAVVLLLPLGAAFMISRAWHQSPRADCKNHLRQMGIALHLYADEHDGTLPGDLGQLFPQHLDNAECLSCPANPSKWKPVRKTGCVVRESTSYVYVAGLKSDDPGSCVVAFDRPGNHDGQGRNVLCLDSSATWLKAPAPGGPDTLKELLDQTREAVQKRGGEIRLVGE